MNSRRLITIDRLFYLPYKILRYFFSRTSTSAQPSGNEIIVMKFMGMGSIACFSSLCDALHVDRSRIMFITFEPQREICQLLGFINTWYLRTSGPMAFLSDCFNLIRRTWEVKPSRIINFERCSNAVGILQLVMGWRTQSILYCFENNNKELFRGRLRAYSARSMNLNSQFKVGIQTMHFIPTANPEQWVDIENQKILINCNASNYLLARRYPKADFIQIVERLHDVHPELEFFFTGSAHEIEYVEDIVRALTAKKVNARNIAGQWNLEQFCNALSQCRLFITCDSGPLHLAASLGVKTFAIWGPTQPEQFGYENLSHIKNYSLHRSCAPCLVNPYSPAMKACHGKIFCMKNISVEILVQLINELISEKSTSRKVRLLRGMTLKPNQTLQPQPL